MKKTVLIILLIFSVVRVYAENTPARELLLKVLERYSTLKTYSGNARVIMSISSQGIENRISYESEIAVKRPDKFYLKNKSTILGRTIISDGNHMWTYLPFLKKYTVVAAPKNIKELLHTDFKKLDTMGTEQFLLFLFFGEKNFLMSDDNSLDIIGTEYIDSAISDILEINSSALDMRVWINLPELNMRYEEIHSNIKLDADIDEDLFRFQPPKKAREVNDLFEEVLADNEFPYMGSKFIDFSVTAVNRDRNFKLSQYCRKVTLLLFINSENRESYDLKSPATGV